MRFTKQIAGISLIVFLIAQGVLIFMWVRSIKYNDVITIQAGDAYYVDFKSWTEAASISVWTGVHPFMDGDIVDWPNWDDEPIELLPSQEEWHRGFDASIDNIGGHVSIRLPHWSGAILNFLFLMPFVIYIKLKKSAEQVAASDR